jgi:hypothetical protein
VRAGLPFVPVRIFSKSSNALKPDVESDHVVRSPSHPVVRPLSSHVKSPKGPSHHVSAICPVASSILSIHPVFSVIVVSHPNIDITFAFIL